MLQGEVVTLSNLYENSTNSGRLFVLAVDATILFVMLHALVNSVGGTEPLGLFNRIYFGQYDMHRYTVLVIFLSFMVHWCSTRYLYPLARFVACSSITVFYIYFHHLLWSLNSVFYRGVGEWKIPFIGTVFVVGVLYQLNSKRGFFKLDFTQRDSQILFGMFMFQVFGLILMAQSGFWVAMSLSDAGVGPDPNINVFWLIWKGSSFWMLYPLLRKSDLRAPLALSPEVF